MLFWRGGMETTKIIPSLVGELRAAVVLMPFSLIRLEP